MFLHIASWVWRRRFRSDFGGGRSWRAIVTTWRTGSGK